MKPIFPPIEAASPAELRDRLALTPIHVVRRPTRRTHASRELYSSARTFATLSESPLLVFPLTIEFRDGPDLALHMPAASIGIECTDAVAEEWAAILDLRAREYPGAVIFLPRLQPDVRSLSQEELRAYASGDKAGPPWIGDSVERDWAKAILHFAEKKAEKLRNGAYSAFAENWLLVHDEWAMHPTSVEKQGIAASLLAQSSAPLFSAPCFSRVLVEGSKWLTSLTGESHEITPIIDLWN